MDDFRNNLKFRSERKVETSYLILQNDQQVMADDLQFDEGKDTITYLNAAGINARNAGTLSIPNPNQAYYSTRPVSDFKDVI